MRPSRCLMPLALLFALLASCGAALAADACKSRGELDVMYCDANGESHWRDVEVEWIEERNFSKLSARLPASGIIFRETSGDYDLSWHPAPRRQYIINLDGGVQITASDGQARTIGAGEVVLVEDTTGKGHLSKSVGGKMRRSIFVPVE